jgi:hypothetical protein
VSGPERGGAIGAAPWDKILNDLEDRTAEMEQHTELERITLVWSTSRARTDSPLKAGWLMPTVGAAERMLTPIACNPVTHAGTSDKTR